MGDVWLATDPRLARTVAIKFMSDRSADAGSRRRFLNEARLASVLSDAGIAQVHDVGEFGGLHYIVMEHVEGMSLEQLAASGPLEPMQVVSVARQLSRALGRAHKRGLLHQDIKPANVVISPEGEAKLIDFGVARLLSRRRPVSAGQGQQDESTHLTVPETMVGGTPVYMAPERLRGDESGPSSEVFSLGVLMYELITGRRPVSSQTAQKLLEALENEDYPSPRSLNPALSEDLEKIILMALKARPYDRPDMETLERKLHVLEEAKLRSDSRYSSNDLDSSSIAVLPFRIDESAFGSIYLRELMGASLAIQLEATGGFRVIPLFRLLTDAPPSAIAAAEFARVRGVAWSLTGHIARTGRELVISAELISTDTTGIAWETRVSGQDASLSELANAIVTSVRTKLGIRASTTYDSHLRLSQLTGPHASLVARATGALRSQDLRTALEVTHRLVEAAPDDYHAWQLRAGAFKLAFLQSPGQYRANLEHCIQILDSLDPNNPEGTLSRGMIQLTLGQPKAALDLLLPLTVRQDMTPDLQGDVWRQVSAGLMKMMRIDEAMVAVEHSLRLSPGNAKAHDFAAKALLSCGRLEEALLRAEQCIALEPTNYFGNFRYAQILRELKRFQESITAFEKACRLGETQSAYGDLAVTHQMAGNVELAASAFQKAQELTKSPWGQFNCACYLALAGREIDALAALQEALALGFCDQELLTTAALQSVRKTTAYANVESAVKERLGI